MGKCPQDGSQNDPPHLTSPDPEGPRLEPCRVNLARTPRGYDWRLIGRSGRFARRKCGWLESTGLRLDAVTPRFEAEEFEGSVR